MSGLTLGAKLLTKNNHKIVVEQELGSGGQGTVYRILYDGKPKALKWYHQRIFTTRDKLELFYENLCTNVENGPPAPEFLWPEDVTQIKDGSFGYVMELRPARFCELSRLLLGRKVRFASYAVRVRAMMHLVSAFRVLHNEGYAYQDLNDGNFFFDPKTGECLVCDNDNALYQGNHTGILGKQRYMAPEIVLGQKMPDKNTDRFSMSVILFMMLVALHPLEGRYSTPPCMTPQYEKLFYGEKPVFIFDPEDERNRPDPALGGVAQALWEQLPDYVRQAFERSFSQECMTYDPKKDHYGKPRLIERDWLAVLTRFYASVYTCFCGNEQILDRLPAQCPKCQADVPVGNYLRLKKYQVPLFPGVELFRCQVGECPDRQALDTVLTVQVGEGGYYILNQSGESWKCVTTKGQRVALPHEGKMPVRPGIRGEIMGCEFEIV